MSARSRIGYVAADGSVPSSYCHFDGYPEGVGATLAESYDDDAKVAALIALGDMSCLYDEFETSLPHSFERPTPNVSVFYHRDRGEVLRTSVDPDADAFYKRAADGWEEYIYLRKDGQWFVSLVGGGAGPFLAAARDPNGELPANWKSLKAVLDGSAELYADDESDQDEAA